MLVDVREQRREDGRHAGQQRRALGLHEARQRLALQEGAGQEQLGAGQRGGEGQAPRVDMEHRHDRQHAVARREPDGVGRADRRRVQRHRAVRVEHALRVAGGAARVAERRRGALVDLGPRVLAGAGLVEKLLVGDGARQRVEVAVAHDHVLAHARQLRRELGQRLDQRAVDEDDAVLGVVDDVDDLLGEQADVQRVQHGAVGGHRHVELEVAL